MMKKWLFGLLGGWLVMMGLLMEGCSRVDYAEDLVQAGVSLPLAQYRKQHIDSLRYNLTFTLPEEQEDSVAASAMLFFNWTGPRSFKKPFVLDFKEEADHIKRLILNGRDVRFTFVNEHVVFPSWRLRKGINALQVEFVAGDQSLNRRDQFMYTLLVPDRARTLFPCFDQPNLKGRYTLQLNTPKGWEAVANSPVAQVVQTEQATIHYFKESEPLSTYLFAFVAGVFQKDSLRQVDPFTGAPRTVTLYYRETEEDKVRQTPRILEEIFVSLEWLESYTGIAYPFAKYDCIALPGFQYGGMEHTGATLYNQDRLFLNPGAGLKEEMSRYSLLAHETAHMWFGDYVTMDWFNDVWTKEVFANYYAAKMLEARYPHVDSDVNFLNYAMQAYDVDRTPGTHAIKQPLDNLRNAGLIYGNIIYDKAPIVMQLLAQMMGDQAFQQGVRAYLRAFAYGNATWEQLVDILDTYSDRDLKSWSRVWVQERGMPHYRFTEADTLTCLDPFGRGLRWEQPISMTAFPIAGREVLIPNLDAQAYGYFELDSLRSEVLMRGLTTPPTSSVFPSLLAQCDAVQQASACVMLYENYRHHTISPARFRNFCLDYLDVLARDARQENTLLFSQVMGYLSHVALHYPVYPSVALETRLIRLVRSAAHSSNRRSAFYCLMNRTSEVLQPQDVLQVQNAPALALLFGAFRNPQRFQPFPLGESDLTALAYQLSIRAPHLADNLLALQRSRITNPDRLQQFDFVSHAVSADVEARKACFESLLNVENRRVEPWALQALGLLNHFLRQEEALSYIRPALDALEEIQMTGDIFFPTSWCSTLLAGHTRPEARAIVQAYLDQNPTLNPLLRAKVLQALPFDNEPY